MKEEIKRKVWDFSVDGVSTAAYSENSRISYTYPSDEAGEFIKLFYPEEYDGWLEQRYHLGGDKKIHNI